MTNLTQNQQHALWTSLENEKRTNQLIKVIRKSSWVVTFAYMTIFTGLTGLEAFNVYKAYKVGLVSTEALIDTVMPFFAIAGGITLLIAVLSTASTFFSNRNSKLEEMQLRILLLEKAMPKDTHTEE